MSDFEKWFIDQDFYTNMRFIHGDNLLSKDGDVYRVLPVQMTYKAWGENQSKIEQLEKEKFLLSEKVRKVEWLLSNNSFDKTIKNCLKILRGNHD